MLNITMNTVGDNLGATITELSAPPVLSGDKVHYHLEAYKAHTDRLKVLGEIETMHLKVSAVGGFVSKQVRQIGIRTLAFVATCAVVCGHFLLK